MRFRYLNFKFFKKYLTLIPKKLTMEVTKSNFKEVFPEVKKAIEECSFMAIDTELTGLSNNKFKEHEFDTAEERYWKLKESSKGFLIIQFGVSCFTFNETTKTYTHKDFNFYIFPKPHCKQAPDSRFICQPSSLLYLTTHGFDFNKCVHEGISYLMPQDEEKLKSHLKTKHEEEQVPKEIKDVHVPEDQKEFVKQVHKKIANFLKDDSQDKLNLEPCTGYQRKLIYETVRQKKLNLDLNTCEDDKNRLYIAVEKSSDEQKSKKLQLKQLADMEELDDAVGFRKVIDVISSSQKLVLGHNMLLDLFHMINQFLHPLPETLREFKDLTRALFPRILDTKTLSSAATFKETITSTSLGNLLTELSKNVYVGTIEKAKNCISYDVNMNKMHEAGYDAFATGYCFIKLGTMLAKPKGFITVESPCLGPYMNRPFIYRHFDLQSLNMRGPDPEPSRDHVFHVTFPKEWRNSDLIDLFSPYGHVYISWLNDISAFVALRSPDQTSNVKKKLLKETRSLYTIKTYAEYHATCSKSNDTDMGAVGDSYLSHMHHKSPRNSLSNLNHIKSSVTEDKDGNSEVTTIKQDNYVSTSQGEGFGKLKTNSMESSKAKKQKTTHNEGQTGEVSSTEKLFEEPPLW